MEGGPYFNVDRMLWNIHRKKLILETIFFLLLFSTKNSCYWFFEIFFFGKRTETISAFVSYLHGIERENRIYLQSAPFSSCTIDVFGHYAPTNTHNWHRLFLMRFQGRIILLNVPSDVSVEIPAFLIEAELIPFVRAKRQMWSGQSILVKGND